MRLTDPCWPWTGYIQENGYGRTWDGGYAHRVSYERHVGPIPEGMILDHLCRNRACVNPAHLEPVTQRVNILRGEGLAARNARKTHCVRGHSLKHAAIRRNGARRCLACDRVRYYQRRYDAGHYVPLVAILP